MHAIQLICHIAIAVVPENVRVRLSGLDWKAILLRIELIFAAYAKTMTINTFA